MKIAEKLIFDETDNKIIHVKTHEYQTSLDLARKLRESGLCDPKKHESVPVGVVPGWLVSEWIKEAGLKWDDNDAIQNLLCRKLMSGEFSKLRGFEGTF